MSHILQRHGTRLDVGADDDLAELDAAIAERRRRGATGAGAVGGLPGHGASVDGHGSHFGTAFGLAGASPSVAPSTP